MPSHRVNTRGYFRVSRVKRTVAPELICRSHVAFQADRTGDEFSRRDDDPAALRGMTGSNGLLKSFRAVNLVVTNGAEFSDIKVAIGKYRRLDPSQDRRQL